MALSPFLHQRCRSLSLPDSVTTPPFQTLTHPLSSFTYKEPCDYVGLTQIISGSLVESHLQSPLCRVRYHLHRFQGLACGHLWGPLPCSACHMIPYVKMVSPTNCTIPESRITVLLRVTCSEDVCGSDARDTQGLLQATRGSPPTGTAFLRGFVTDPHGLRGGCTLQRTPANVWRQFWFPGMVLNILQGMWALRTCQLPKSRGLRLEILICTQDCEAGKPWKDLWAETCARDLSAPHAIFNRLTQLQFAGKKTERWRCSRWPSFHSQSLMGSDSEAPDPSRGR